MNDAAGRADEREALLVGFLEEFAALSRCGKTPDFAAVGRTHPELVDELRELWATAMVAEDLATLSQALDGPEGTSDGPPAATRAEPERVGDYEILEEIGRGGMGVVYRARQRSLGRTVALKRVLRGALASAADRTRFRAEAESAARLHHPHITPVYEVGEEEGQPYFSMQLIEGTTLARRIAEGPLPPREAARTLLPVCRAIAEAHRGRTLASGFQAFQHPHRSDGACVRERLRAGQARDGRPVAAGRRRAGRVLGDPQRGDCRHSGLHGARAGGRQSGRSQPGHRRLRTGRVVIRHVDGPRSVSIGLAGRHGAAGARAGSASSACAQSAGRRRPGDDRAQVSAEAGRPALPDGRRAGRRPGGVPWPTSRSRPAPRGSRRC